MPDQPDVEVATVDAVPTAVTDHHITRTEIAQAIGKGLDVIWTFIRPSDLTPDNSIVLYKGNPDAGADIEVGVRVDRTFDPPPDSNIRCSELPAGRVVRGTHCGPYSQMAPTYQAIERYIKDNDFTVIGPSWEIYGDWHEDESQLETEIVFRIAP